MKKIPLYSLILLIVAAIDSVRNLPTAALFGSSLIFFFILSALVFLLPTALVSAELTAAYPEKGGVYHWIHTAFGAKCAMAAIWMQWINTMVWYPTILSFIAGTAAYLISPSLAENKMYLISFVLASFWLLTFINLFGIHFSSKINSFCALAGTVLPMILLIVLGIVWVLYKKPLQITCTGSTFFPSFSSVTSWSSLIAIMASFLGMELAGVHVNDIKNPQRNFPKAVLLSSFFILFSMMFGSLAIAFVLPADQINLVSGVMQMFSSFFEVFHLTPLIPVLTIFIVLGSLGGIINWLISPAKGLLHAAEYGFLPPFFRYKNKRGAPSRILISQAVLVSSFCSLLFFVPSVNGFYWFLTALSTELYMIMYILMFLAAICLHYKYANREQAFKIPGKQVGIWTTCLLGIFGCVTTIAVSFFPPGNIHIGSSSQYIQMILIANVLTISPVLLFYRYRARKNAGSS